MKKFDALGPMDEMLRAAQGSARFHMPGHKGLIEPFDMTELSRTDDLYAPVSGIARAEALAARACGAYRTLMLTGGSTAGILAMLLSALSPGDMLLLPRDAHHAAVSACVWGGIDAVFVDDLEEGILQNPKASAVFVTRPDYYGGCPPLAPLVRLAREWGMLVLVDEAHGAHFPWWDAPESAGRLGADAWVQSAHKTLPALTGAAFLHLSKTLDEGRVRRFLRMVQTSSPPFPVLLSLDNARAWMDQHGVRALVELRELLADVRLRLSAMEGYCDMSRDDPTRLVIGTRARGYSGLAAAKRLAERHVDVEMADDHGIVCICTVADEPEDFVRLLSALSALPPRKPLSPLALAPPPPGLRVLPLRLAALAPQEAVPLGLAAGRVASVAAGMYPPGVPLVLPGEEVTEACAVKLKELPPERRFGVDGDCLICVR